MSRLNLTFNDLTQEQARRLLAVMAGNAAATETEETDDTDLDDEIEETPTRTKTKATKKAKADEDEDLDEETEDDDGPTTADVVKALRSYTKRHDRESAAKILKKFKVKSVEDLDDTQMRKILKLLA